MFYDAVGHRTEPMLSTTREALVTFPGATASLRGKILATVKGPWRIALVAAHGRNGDMDEPLVAGIAKIAADLGLWTLRFNFAYQETGSEPSAGYEAEIADLREAVACARRTSRADRVVIAGRGLGAWAAVAAATDEDTEDVILLGLSYAGQPERRTALERLSEFGVAALVFVGSTSDRADVPALRELLEARPTNHLVIVDRADHRLRDASGETRMDAVLARCVPWLRKRIG